MRLYDKLLCHNSSMGFSFRESSADTTVLAADAIAHYAHSHWEFSRCQSEFPCSLPAFRNSFVEWNHPLYETGSGIIQQVGVAVNALTSVGCEPKRHSEKYLYAASRSYVPGLGSGSGLDLYDTEFLFQIYVCIRGRALGTPFPVYCYFSSGDLIFVRAMGWGSEHGMDDDDLPDSPLQRGDVLEIARIALLAFTFLNCSNVKLQDVTSDLEPPPKIKRRLRIPDVKRYTLNINGHYSRPRRELSEPGEKDVMPFHLCRGHFATYTDAAPLFGKYTGRFWIPPHTKGKKENGVIEKDYAIVN